MRPWPILALLLAACSPSHDKWGGGTFTLSVADGPVAGTLEAPGADVRCLRDRNWCDEPHLSVLSPWEDDPTITMWSVHATFALAPEEYDLACFGGEPIELDFLAVYNLEDDEGSWVRLHLHDPVKTSADPNADQGEPTSPYLDLSSGLDDHDEVALHHSLTATLEPSDARQDCDAGVAPTEIEVSWAFDREVTAGPGEFSPPE